MKKTILIFFLMCSVCLANTDKVKDKNGVEWRPLDVTDFDVVLDDKGKTKEEKLKGEYTFIPFTAEIDVKGVYKSIVKLDIAEDKLLTEEESKAVKMTLWNEGLVDDVSKKVKEGQKLIFKELMPARNDYKHNHDRGTVFYTQKNRNYSYSKVIIPDGTVIEEVNFTQKHPDTSAIEGKNLTFISCNLVNVKIDPTWILIDCNDSQIQKEIIEQIDLGDGTTKIKVSYKVKNKKTGLFEPNGEDEKIIYNSDLSNMLLRYN